MPLFDYNELDEFRGLIDEPSPSPIPPTPTPTPGGGLFNADITGLIGGGIDNLDGFELNGSGADFTVGDHIQFDISDTNATVDIPAGFSTYEVITNAAAVSKYGSSATNAPYVIRATDFIAGDAVWERR